MVEVTDVRIKKIETDGKLRAYVSIVLNESFAIHDIKIIEGNTGLFIAMPSKKYKNEFADIAHPINKETRKIIETAILTEYNKE